MVPKMAEINTREYSKDGKIEQALYAVAERSYFFRELNTCMTFVVTIILGYNK